MEIALTWNLVILAVLVMIAAYNFLLGQNATIKLTLSIYIAIFTADGVAKIFRDFLFAYATGLQEVVGDQEMNFFRVVRLILFIVAIVFFVVKGAFHVAVARHDHWALRMGIHAVFAILSAMLFLSTILIYLSGNSFVEGMIFAHEIKIFGDSLLAQILIDYYQIWFTLPSLAFLASSFFFESSREE